MMTPSRTGREAALGSPQKAVPLRGRFINGIWCCNCPNRPPAAEYQTKNHGTNHGKWFYTCQQPTGRRCEFFLWKSDAEAREKLVLLSNSRSEEHMTTPRRTPRGSTATGLLTPTTDRRVLHGSTTPSKSVKSATSARETMMLEDTDPAWWEDSTDDDVRSRPLQQPEFRSESSRKAPRTASLTSPGKRKASEMTSNSTPKTPSLFTPKTSTLFSPRTADSSSRYAPPPSAEVSLTPTPTKYRDVLSTESYSESSDLSRSTLSLLDKHSVVLPKAAQDEMLALLNKHDLRTRGISRGRDISRVALKKKDEEIKVLNEKIEDLKTQLDMSRTVLDGMRMAYNTRPR